MFWQRFTPGEPLIVPMSHITNPHDTGYGVFWASASGTTRAAFSLTHDQATLIGTIVALSPDMPYPTLLKDLPHAGHILDPL